MYRLLFLLWYHTRLWPWELSNRSTDSQRIIIKNRKFRLDLRSYETRIEIEFIFVEPAYRTQGLGRNIIEAVKQFARRENISVQASYVLLEAMVFWEKMQFKPQGQHAVWSPEK